MKKAVLGCFVAFVLQFTSAQCAEIQCAEMDCNPCEPICGVKAGKWFLYGHIEAGFFANAHGQKSLYADGAGDSRGRNLVLYSGNTDWLGNARLTGAQVNQIYAAVGRKVDGRHGLDVGGKAAFTFGSDAHYVQTHGLERASNWEAYSGSWNWGTGDYYAAFAEAYTEVAYKRLNVKVGKFEIPFGSNPDVSTERFFYTLDPAEAFFLHHIASGAYGTYNVGNGLEMFAGWVTPGEFFARSGVNYLLGGFSKNVSNRVNTHNLFLIASPVR
jgi:hypothetical protein